MEIGAQKSQSGPIAWPSQYIERSDKFFFFSISKVPQEKEEMKEPKEEMETKEMLDLFDVDVKEIEDCQEIKVYWDLEVVLVQWVLQEWMVYQ